MATKRTSRRPEPLLLYSATSWLAFAIGQRYYDDQHFVWCSPHFDARTAAARDAIQPPTSSPAEIYHSLWEEVERGDRHSAKIKENKVGVLYGATQKRKAGTISRTQEREIATVVDRAQVSDFRPLIYVIPFGVVRKLVKPAPVGRRAHPLADEWIIESLDRKCFDILELRRR